MSHPAVKKLLLSKGKPAQLFLALFGAFLGLLIFMAGIQVYANMRVLMAQKDMLGGDYIVINKKVGILHTISGNTPVFSEEEITDLQKVESIDQVGQFASAGFKASLEIDGKMADMAGPGLKSDIFFEAVPDSYVDVAAEEWSWRIGDPVVPIIVPSDYIKLYNMAFAQSQGLPVIPESMIKSVTFKLRLRGNGKEGETQGRIAGFSQRINSILVPQAFLDHANKNYGSGAAKKPARLILHSKDPTSPKLSADLRAKGYELNEEKLRSSEINSILQILITVVSGVGMLIVVLALLGFMQYNQLMAYRSAYEIQTLHWLGFKISAISAPFIRFNILSIAFTFIGSSAVTFGLQWAFTKWLESKGFAVELPATWLPLLYGFVISLAMAGLSSMVAYRQVKSLSR
jgi:hypothetical protein